ncbi:TPA: hypothetical protein O5912_003144 [Legionella pneumophila]|uniref:hypothetical protein n=1 Tax=Legionella pneumophila TaxID=446 RepID=UPI00047F9F2C|nr:hypothetical protein [Legionella pneumophila]STY14444.1 Uncharacterised protein [Legionella pneumophila]HAT1740211.1 hypothetical protein [Legionella pneumophila]HAT1746167.1 hypothetical protein [Legionella pneumophila]HAT1749099.1 hypothetical protein [Legionella pneumophila]HAT1755107.1 hypothetical protein [Legionella pneumophila]
MKKLIAFLLVSIAFSTKAQHIDLNKMIRKDWGAYIINETMYTQTITYSKCKVNYLPSKYICEPEKTINISPFSNLFLGESKRTLPENTWDSYHVNIISNNSSLKDFGNIEETPCKADFINNIIIISDYDSNDIFCSIASER